MNTYKKARELRQFVSKVMRKKLPSSEKYTLLDQIIRSSRSVAANIAEGHGRFYYKENIRFCRIARGSLEETLEHFHVALDEGYITKEDLRKFENDHYQNCRRLIDGYIRYLGNTKPGKGKEV